MEDREGGGGAGVDARDEGSDGGRDDGFVGIGEGGVVDRGEGGDC